MIRSFLTSVALVAIGTAPALAWGKTGHRVTGAIADDYLTAQARQAIEAILGVETLAEASTWADFMRASDEPFWREEAGPYHYVTVPPGQTYAEVGHPQQGDAVSALEQFARTLRDPNALLEDKQLALRFMVHIIGDLHQPLHAGDGTDRGGNDVRVTWFGESANLHSVWDTKMVDHEQLSYTEMADWLTDDITPELAADWMVADPEVWIGESSAVRDTIYPDEDQLGWDYAFEHRETMRIRLSQGGVRIAAYLNFVFAQ
ncbi:S1/P1 nuclease [Marinicauda pacifica]|uniref:S1/P1 nuclease n=1 Tax=Marinicauda pacifica TaxID=1133559 RepID=UPI0035C79D8C